MSVAEHTRYVSVAEHTRYVSVAEQNDFNYQNNKGDPVDNPPSGYRTGSKKRSAPTSKASLQKGVLASVRCGLGLPARKRRFSDRGKTADHDLAKPDALMAGKAVTGHRGCRIGFRRDLSDIADFCRVIPTVE